jgi:hypothetical protein
LVGVEAKNIREWLYPHRDEVAQLLLKCCQLDAVPVLIARRIHFLTGRVFRTCGMVTHEMFTQLYPAADIDLANQAKHKNLLGYHDIRVGNAPDQRLLKFTLVNLPKILPAARRDFDHAKGPLLEYLKRKLSWHHFLIEIGLRDDPEEHGWDPSWNPNPD